MDDRFDASINPSNLDYMRFSLFPVATLSDIDRYIIPDVLTRTNRIIS